MTGRQKDHRPRTITVEQWMDDQLARLPLALRPLALPLAGLLLLLSRLTRS